MAKPLVFAFGNQQTPVELQKVDRSTLYGYKEVETLDEQGRVCSIATLADDGRTLVGKGGTGVGHLSADGNWCNKADLIPVDLEGNRIQPVPSSYSAPVPLVQTASVDEYMSHSIRSVYRIEFLEAADELTGELRGGKIFRFDYSFRGGLEFDAGFLLANDAGQIFMVVGSESETEFVGLQQAAAPTEAETDGGGEDDALDFNMI